MTGDNDSPTEPAKLPMSGASPLSYEAPRDRVARGEPDPREDVVVTVGVVAFGAAISAATTIFVSIFLYVGAFETGKHYGDGPHHPRWHAKDVALGATYFVAALLIVMQCSRHVRRTPTGMPGKWFRLGLLIGVGLACLLEGACFAAPK